MAEGEVGVSIRSVSNQNKTGFSGQKTRLVKMVYGKIYSTARFTDLQYRYGLGAELSTGAAVGFTLPLRSQLSVTGNAVARRGSRGAAVVGGALPQTPGRLRRQNVAGGSARRPRWGSAAKPVQGIGLGAEPQTNPVVGAPDNGSSGFGPPRVVKFV